MQKKVLHAVVVYKRFLQVFVQSAYESINQHLIISQPLASLAHTYSKARCEVQVMNPF